jgi:hypothetical protein
VKAQNSDFANFLLEMQNITAPLHKYMLDAFFEGRFKLSIELTELNDEAVFEITEGLRSMIVDIDGTEAVIEEVSTPENGACVNQTINAWTAVRRSGGVEIQACADAHVDPIYSRTEEFHLFLQDHNYFLYDAQNMVLKIFKEVRWFVVGGERLRCIGVW